MSSALSRRHFLATSASSAWLASRASGADAEPAPWGFFLVGDTHFYANPEDNTRLDERSERITGRLVDLLNELPGTEIPAPAGGGQVLAPRGVIHAGDCIDTGDKANTKMQATEWSAFSETYGLTGTDGRLKVPVYEVHGNHDSPRGDGLAVKQIIERNQRRPGLVNVSENGLHYSWDWGGVHFINLGIVVGEEIGRRRRYSPLGSLDFLKSDLRDKVGTSGRPIVITHHVDLLRYSQPLPVEDMKAVGMEWDPMDAHSYYEALQGYTVAAILYGHTHGRNVYRWNGTPKPAATGVPTFNVDNSSHYHGQQQAFFYFEVGATGLTVREYQTKDAWATGFWTPQTWTAPYAVCRAT